MTTYPGAIDEFRNTANIQGVVFNPDDETTVFAEDTNGHSDAIVAIETALGVNPAGDFETVADRLDAGGGGGGAWELIYDQTISGGGVELFADGLDLQSDCVYEVYFGASCGNEITRITYHGSSEIFVGWKGSLINGTDWTFQSAPPYISHPSIGAGVGKLTITTTPNGSANMQLGFNLGNQRAYEFKGADLNYYSGGINLTGIKLRTNTDYNLDNGSYMRVFRRAL